MTTEIIKRDEAGRWLPGACPNPTGRAPETVSAAFRRLAREVEIVAGELPSSRAERLARVAFDRAMDDDRKDAVLWARLILERCDGPPRNDASDSLGFGEIAAREYERWALKSGEAVRVQEGG